MSSRETTKGAKKKVYNVPSRYKKGSESSIFSSREKSSSKSSKELSSQDIPTTSKLSTSPHSIQGMTSTPSCKRMFTFPPLDASAVTDGQGHLVPSLKERIVPTPTDFLKKNLHKQKVSNVTILENPVIALSKKKSDSFDENIASAEIDILYAQYLQSVFFKQESERALKARSSAALETLHKLLMLVTEYLHKVKSRKVLLKVLNILIEWNSHCQKQHEILKPVFEIIPNLEEQYKSLAEAISVTKHKLPVKDVILPDSDEIQEMLQKLNKFITAYFEAVPNYTDVISSSNILQKYVDFAEFLTNELKRGVDLLTEAKGLCISEASLALGCENSEIS